MNEISDIQQRYPTVSVVMPVYNGAQYIEEAIQSVLDQTMSDFEFIIINDGSTDDTEIVIRTFDDERIRLINKSSNEGVAAAINDGFAAARGEYIARFDADDICVPERFEKQLAFLHDNPEIMICGSWIKEFGGSDRTISYKPDHENILVEMLRFCAICMPSSMIRKRITDKFRIQNGKYSGEDYEYWSRVIWEGKTYNIQEVLYLYRIHEGQASQLHLSHQRHDDASIQLNMYKRLGYDSNQYPDFRLTKLMIWGSDYNYSDLKLFFEWHKVLLSCNRKQRVYERLTFQQHIARVRRTTIFTLFFHRTDCSMAKSDKLKVLSLLSLAELAFVSIGKLREVRKRIFSRKS